MLWRYEYNGRKPKKNLRSLKRENERRNMAFVDIVVEGISLLDTKQKESNSRFNKLGAEGTLLHLKHINQRSLTTS
ncbi:hypothetical protein AADZ91_00870 [Colwelliaceae bacterium 6441]